MTLLRWTARAAAWSICAVLAGSQLLAPGGVLSRVAMESPALTITGSIDNLVPGTPAQLTLTVHNGSGADAVVRTLTARVSGASRGCSPTALRIESWQGSLSVPSHGAATASLPVLLDASAAGCEAATWQLAYTSG